MVGREPRDSGFQAETTWTVAGGVLTLHARAADHDGVIKDISFALVDTPESPVINIPGKIATELLDKLKEACK